MDHILYDSYVIRLKPYSSNRKPARWKEKIISSCTLYPQLIQEEKKKFPGTTYKRYNHSMIYNFLFSESRTHPTPGLAPSESPVPEG